ncbi:MAG TPA: outer membrane beta-barrel protein [Pyrinomonadaceae bacterium]|nr:outer membrane beta-barrel protein [Pyrinomonadaceae bacterium]
MRKVILLAIFIACFASVSFAQDRARTEVFGGFSVNSIDTGLSNSGLQNVGDRETGLGFDASVTGYFNRSFGIEGNVDGHYKRKTFVFSDAVTPATDVRTHISDYNFMAGPHVRFAHDNTKVTPFVHALVGANHVRVSADVLGDRFNDNETDLGLKLGGGVDFDMTTHTAVRLGADYNPVFERSNNNGIGINDNRTRNDFSFSVGIVFK